MDKHDKDYFVPNFGVDHDIITTQNNFKKAGGKLMQVDSIPACNSDKGCKTNTASPWKQRGDPIDEVPNFPAPTVPVMPVHKSLAQQESVPACNSADFPGCLKAETAADQKLQADMDKHDKDYFVPNFGVDHDIITT
jgi:hypothetical protein